MQQLSSRLLSSLKKQLGRALVKVKYGIIGAGAVSDFHRKPARSLLLLLPLALLRLRP